MTIYDTVFGHPEQSGQVQVMQLNGRTRSANDCPGKHGQEYECPGWADFSEIE
jgi:hypothetical protein